MSQRRAAHLRRQASVDHPRYPPHATAQPQPQAQQQFQHLVQPSDYESDNAGNLSDYPSQPPPPTRTNEELNLSVLKRHNPKVVSILSIAPYAVVYEFSPSEAAWTKNGVEGSLFLNQLEPGAYGEDRYSALVLNRRGLDNFEAELRDGDRAGVEITEEYVIISSEEGHEQKINGIFIFSEGPGTDTENTRTQNADLMKALAAQAGLSRKAAEAAAAEATATPTNGHMQQAEAPAGSQMGEPMGRQMSLQQMFGQQRAEDASFTVRNHSPQNVGQDLHAQRHGGSRQTQVGSQPVPQQSDVLLDLFAGSRRTQPPAQPPTQPPTQQSDVLMDLFRNVGGMPKI